MVEGRDDVADVEESVCPDADLAVSAASREAHTDPTQ